jgi:DNA-binding transcriptional ArsR family regulator
VNTTQLLDATFAALADPTRRAILARLASGETSVKDLCEPFELSQPAISKHLKVLERAGLIARSREAQSRPARLKPEPLKQAADWIDHYRKFWEESFDRLDAYLQSLQEADARPPVTDTPRPRKMAPLKEKPRTKHRK